MRISPFLAGYIRKRATQLMVDQCQIYTSSVPQMDVTSGLVTRTPGGIKYEGPCRVWEVRGGVQQLIGDIQQNLNSTYLSIPWDAPLPESDDSVVITKSVDSDLEGRTVSIQGMTRGGGLRASRVFLVQLQDSSMDTW